jgi:hypothetical protein
MMAKTFVGPLILAALAACTSSPLDTGHDSVGGSFHGGISSISLMRKGTNAVFCREPDQMPGVGSVCQPLSTIASSIPHSWPDPPTLTLPCTDSYRILVNFVDGAQFGYGSCGVPLSIASLQQAMVAKMQGTPTASPTG